MSDGSEREPSDIKGLRFPCGQIKHLALVCTTLLSCRCVTNPLENRQWTEISSINGEWRGAWAAEQSSETLGRTKSPGIQRMRGAYRRLSIVPVQVATPPQGLGRICRWTKPAASATSFTSM